MSDNRRNFLGKVCGTLAATAAAGTAGLAVIPIVDPLLRPGQTVVVGDGEAVLGAIDRFKLNKAQRVAISADRRDAWQTTRGAVIGTVWVTKTAEPDTFQVLSTICPHLGCGVNQEDGGFICRCHNSTFGPDGARKEAATSPAPRDMDGLPHTVKDGVLYCTYQRFALNVAEKVEA